MKFHSCHYIIWYAKVFEEPCTSGYRCIWGNKLDTTTASPEIITTTKFPHTTSKITTTKLPDTTPKPEPVKSSGIILWVLAGIGGFLLIGLIIFLIFKNYRKITIRNQTITPRGWENRFTALIGTIKKFHNQYYTQKLQKLLLGFVHCNLKSCCISGKLVWNSTTVITLRM